MNTQVKSNHGIFQVKLALFNGSEATFSGICLDQITVKFPQYPLKRIVEELIADTKDKEITQKICRKYNTVCWG